MLLSREVELPAEQSMALAIDVDNLDEANRLAKVAKDCGAGIIKVGLELVYSASPETYSEVAADNGLDWLADLKTMATTKTMKALESIVGLAHPPIGITVDAWSGLESLRLAQSIANTKGIVIFGVPLLSTIGEAETMRYQNATPLQIVGRGASLVADAGARGVVCSGEEIALIRHNKRTKDLIALIVGTSLDGQPRHDQIRVTSQYEAAKRGGDLFEVGREVYESEDPAATYVQIAEAIRSGRKAAKVYQSLRS